MKCPQCYGEKVLVVDDEIFPCKYCEKTGKVSFRDYFHYKYMSFLIRVDSLNNPKGK